MSHDRFAYPASLTPARKFAAGETGYVVSFRDLPEIVTQGDDREKALAEAVDALEEAVAGRIVRNEAIPAPSKHKRGETVIPLPPQMAAKAGLYLAMRQSRIPKTELARRLHCDEKDVRRLLDPHHGSKLPMISAALAALGKRLVIDVCEV
jgi:antitoxin HicB